MEIGTIEKIFKFLQNNEGKEIPKKFLNSIEYLKLIEELENHPDGTQYRYNGRLNLSYSKIKKLPNDLYVEGDLSLTYCKQLTELPDDLYVGGILDLEHTNITSLPKGLKVGSIEGLKYTNITSLPEGLEVGQYLDLRGCYNIDSLPKGLKVDGGLSLRGLKMRFLPKGLEVGLYLDLRDSKITLLPKGLKVGESLSIANTPLAKKYNDEEIRKIVASTGGEIIGEIYR